MFGLVGFGFSAQPSGSATSPAAILFVPAMTFAVLSVGVLCARPDRGVMAVVTGPGAGGSIVRWLLPVAVAIPVAIGWLRLLGERAGLYGAAFGVSLMVALTVVCLVVALWWAGRSLEVIDLERLRAQEELRAAHDELEERVRLRTEELASANAALKAQIVERERAEESIRSLNADLRDRVAQLSVVNRDLEQQTIENEAFVYSVSHDLRSPLVNLQGFSKELGLACEEMRELFAENSLPEAVRKRGLDLIDGEVEESIQFIRTAVMRLSDIIDALLRLSRAGRVEYRPERADLCETVRRIVESMSGTIADRGATVTVREVVKAVRESEEWTPALLPTGEGLLVAVKR